MTNSKISLLIILAAMTTAQVISPSCTPDPCDNIECLNGGECNDGKCICLEGYEGSDCGTAARTKFIGSYTVTNSCLGSSTYSCSVAASSKGADRIDFFNIANNGWTATGVITGSTNITINCTITDGNCGSVTITGNGSIANNIISLTNVTYAIADTTLCPNMGPCTETLVKK